MSVVLMTSFGTSPGATATSVALALAWPRPVVLVEADISKPSSVIPGYMRARVSAHQGLVHLVHAPAGTLTAETVWHAAVPLLPDPRQAPDGYDRLLLPALPSPESARGMDRLWPDLVHALARLDTAGVDAIIDAGRWGGTRDPRRAMAERADHVLFCTRPTLPSLAALNAGYGTITEVRAERGRADHHSLLTIDGPTSRLPQREIERFLRLGTSGTIPWDPRWGAVYSDGQGPPAGLRRGTYQAAIRSLAGSLEKKLREARDLMSPTPATAGRTSHDS